MPLLGSSQFDVQFLSKVAILGYLCKKNIFKFLQKVSDSARQRHGNIVKQKIRLVYTSMKCTSTMAGTKRSDRVASMSHPVLKTTCSLYVCLGSSCNTYGHNLNTENQCLYFINFLTNNIFFTQKTIDSLIEQQRNIPTP
jgi:hypothetical protein